MRPRPLIKNRDYTVRPDGAWVFSREHLLSRGTCCASKCLNCPYEFSRVITDVAKRRPVISMVPSWTETLIHAGFHVVGRTRYCVHPADSVRSIRVLGGTKTIADSAGDFVTSLLHQANEMGIRPLVILDQEENPKSFKEFFDELGCDVLVTHVTGLISFKTALGALSDALIGVPGEAGPVAELRLLAARIKPFENVAVSKRTFIDSILAANQSIAAIEAMLRESHQQIYYFIWKNPWMIVSSGTWISEIVQNIFPNAAFLRSDSRYPEIEESDIPDDAILLFSSEPFAFEKQWSSLTKLRFVSKAKGALLVDGESFSWFGIRSIRFLEDSQISP